MTRVLTVLVAAWVALAPPVGQLRWAAVERACCCPDPDRCMCPHDEHPSPADTVVESLHCALDPIP